MSNENGSNTGEQFQRNAMTSFIQIGALLLLLAMCYRIVAPFIPIVIWGVIISVALYPGHLALSARLGGREKISAAILVLIGLAIIVIPVVLTAESSVESAQKFAANLSAGQVAVPPPRQAVADWPIIGGPLYDLWDGAATNLEATMNTYSVQLRSVARGLAGFAAGIMIGTLQFMASIVLAGALLLSAAPGYRTTRSVAEKLVGPAAGEKMTTLSIMTIRSVVKGVLGVALIQAVLSAIGLVAIGVPAPGLWAGAVLIIAIVQLPPLLVLGPIAIWVFSVAPTVPATIFLVYSFLVSISDAFLKPLFLGRGVDIPVLVILIGAIGGALAMGIIGLFLGAVVLAVSYELLAAWIAPQHVADIVDA